MSRNLYYAGPILGAVAVTAVLSQWLPTREKETEDFVEHSVGLAILEEIHNKCERYETQERGGWEDRTGKQGPLYRLSCTFNETTFNVDVSFGIARDNGFRKFDISPDNRRDIDIIQNTFEHWPSTRQYIKGRVTVDYRF